MPGLPAHHQLLELAQTHIHRVSDAIQPSHPLSFPSPGDLPNPGIEPGSPALQADSLLSKLTSSVQFSSVTHLCPTPCHPMDCSTPGFPVHHQLLELAQTHVHHISDAIQPSHPLSSLSPPALNLSQIERLGKLTREALMHSKTRLQ